MKHTILIGILLFFVTFASPSEKKRVSPSPNEVGRLALKKVQLDWRPVGWTIEFKPGRNGYLGRTCESEKKIIIWIRREHSSAQVAATVVHELAHVFDWLCLTDEMRAQWLTIRELSLGTPWYPSCKNEGTCSDYRSGAGDFAESVSWTLQGPKTGFRSKLAPPPNKKQQDLIRRWFSNVIGM